MSRNEWEKGTLKFSNTKGYRDFKKRVTERYMAQIKKDVLNANAALAALKAKKPKGSRNFDWNRELRQLLCSGPYELKALREWSVAQFMTHDKVVQTEPFQKVTYVLRKAPRQFTAKEAGTVSMKTLSISMGEYGLDFNDKERLVRWRVSENNHACERARESFLGGLVFEEFAKADWGRSGGGVIVGNDEYHSGYDGAGEGANYIKDVYGPAGRKAAEFEERVLLHSVRTMRRRA